MCKSKLIRNKYYKILKLEIKEIYKTRSRNIEEVPT